MFDGSEIRLSQTLWYNKNPGYKYPALVNVTEYVNKQAIYMAIDLRINNNHYLITCGGWCRLRSLLDEDKSPPDVEMRCVCLFVINKGGRNKLPARHGAGHARPQAPPLPLATHARMERAVPPYVSGGYGTRGG